MILNGLAYGWDMKNGRQALLPPTAYIQVNFKQIYFDEYIFSFSSTSVFEEKTSHLFST